MEMNRAELAAVDGVACDLLDAHGRLVVTPNALTLDGQRNVPADLQPGENLAAFLARHVPGIASGAWAVSIGGATVPQAMWAHTFPKHGQVIACRALVAKQVVQLAAIAVLSYFTIGAGGGLWGINAAAALGSNGLMAAQWGAFMAGSLLINKVLGPKVPKVGEAAAARQAYSLSGQRNSARAYESLPVLWGEMRVTPDLAGQPYAWFEGDDQYLSTILLGGVNVHSAFDLAIGDTPLASFEEVSTFFNGFSGMASEDVPLYSNADSIAGAELENDGAWVKRTSSSDTVALQVDIEGQLYDLDNKSNALVNSVPLFIETRVVGTEAWQSALSTTLSNSTVDVVRRTFSVPVALGQHEVRVRLGKPTYNEGDGKDACKFAWNVLKSIQPDTADYSQWGRIGIKIKATGQISGSLDTVRATYRARPLPVWSGTEWITATTRAEGLSNPGAILLQTLRGVYANGVLQFGFGMSDEQIDIEGLKAFMLHCAARGYTYDRWITGSMSLGQFCEEVALAGMGEFSWTDGSRPTAVFVSSGQPLSGVVNMANMLKGSFSVAYNLANAADGIEYQYLDRDRNWETQTLRVAAPGVTTMLNPARITGEGVTTEAHAAVLARYHLAQSLYQYKTIDFGADIEHLAYRRLSVLSISHDLTQWGFGGRVMAAGLNAAGKVELQLDEPVPPMPQAYVGLRVPGARDYRVFKVEALESESEWITLVEPWPEGIDFPGEDLDNPAHDTLWCYDFKATPGYRVRVTGMQPEADLKGAQVTCVPEGPEFWDYVLNGTYTPAPNHSSLPQLGRPIVSNLRITEKVNVQGDTEWYSLSLVWDVDGDYDHAQVWAGRDGSELRLVDGNAVGSRAEFRIDGAGEWLVEVRPFNASGLVGESATVLFITGMTQLPPRNVDTLAVHQVAGELRRFVWTYNGDQRPLNFAGVQIRYAPGDVALSVADWDNLTPIGTAEDIYKAALETTRPDAGTWTFACRAINTAGQLANGVRTVSATLQAPFAGLEESIAEVTDGLDDVVGVLTGGEPLPAPGTLVRPLIPLTGTLSQLLTGSATQDPADLLPLLPVALIPMAQQQDAINRETLQGLADTSEALLRTTLDARATAQLVRDAGIYVDPVNGKVHIYAVDANAERTNALEIRMDSVTGQLALRATTAYVNQAIAQAALGEADLVLFEGMDARVTEVELLLDSVNGEMALKASTLSVTEMGAQVVQVEQRLNVAEQTLISKVNQADFQQATEGLTGRIGSAEQTLAAIGDVASITSTVAQSRKSAEILDEDAETTLRDLLSGWQARRAQAEATALATQEMRAYVDEGFGAQSLLRTQLEARTAAAAAQQRAQFSQEVELLTDADKALGTQIEQLAVQSESDKEELAAAIDEAAEVSAGANAALAQTVSQVSAQSAQMTDEVAETQLQDVLTGWQARRAQAVAAAQATEETRAYVDANLAAEVAARQVLQAFTATAVSRQAAEMSTERTLRTSKDDALGERIDVLTVKLSDDVSEVTAQVSSASAASVDRDGALAEQIDAVVAVVDSNASAFSAQISALADDQWAQAQQLSSLQATAGDLFASITEQGIVLADIDGRVSATWSLGLTAGEKIAGVVFANDGVLRKAVFLTDVFAVAQGDDANPSYPFVVGSLNGVPAVTFNANLFVDGGIQARHLSAQSVTADKLRVTNLSAVAANLGDVTAGVVRNPDSSNFFNLSAQGSQVAFQIGGGKVHARADGYVEMDRVNVRRREVIASGSVYWGQEWISSEAGWSHSLAGSIFVIDTGIMLSDASDFGVVQPYYAIAACSNASTSGGGAGAIFDLAVSCQVALSAVHSTSSGSSPTPNPRLRIILRPIVSPLGDVWRIQLNTFNWSLFRI